MAIQSLKQLTVRIDKLGITQYHVRELIEKIDIHRCFFTFNDYETGITFDADNKDKLYELTENHYTDSE